MIELDCFEDFSIPCGEHGELKPLTLGQMVDMRSKIRNDLMEMTRIGLSGEDLMKASASAAGHVSEMGLIDQAEAIVKSPILMAQAAALMLGRKDWAPMTAANSLEREHIPAIRKAVYRSYGVKFLEPGEAKKDPDPPTAATDSTN